VPIRSRDDLSRSYTPVVVPVCLSIKDDPSGRFNADHKEERGVRRASPTGTRGAGAGLHRPRGREGR